MQIEKFQLILGSQSPRRKELLQYTYLPFQIEVFPIEETSSKVDQAEVVMDLAEQKAQVVFDQIKEKYSNPIVLGADTIVCLDEKILGKPADDKEASEMLMSLSGRSHDVLTGICLLSKKKKSCFYEKTKVTFEKIDHDLLAHYISTQESLDKAGAYGIQAYSLGFIKSVSGSYSNVVGLPVNLVIKKIKDFLEQSEDTEGRWRKYFE